MKTFRGALAKDAFAVTVELSWDEEDTAQDILQVASDLADYVDGIHLAENRLGHAQISSSALAALLLREGIDATPTIQCRDRNRIALQSELLGLRAIRVSSLVLNRGRPIPIGPDATAANVFDVDERELISIAHGIDESGWIVGTDYRVPDSLDGWNGDLLKEHANAGAQLLRLRPCDDMNRLRDHMAKLVEEKLTWSYSIIATIAVGTPQQTASIINEVATIPGISGANLLYSGDPQAIIKTLMAAGRSTSV